MAALGLRCCAQPSHCGGFSCCGARASVVTARELSRSAACGILPDQGSNPCPLHWQANSQQLHHQGSPGWIFKIYLFILFFWLCWVFVSMRGLSLVVASGGHSSLWCVGFSLSRPLLLRGTGSRHAGSVVAAHGPSCSAACGIFPDQGLNPCPLHWQAYSQPLRHQGSPIISFKIRLCKSS